MICSLFVKCQICEAIQRSLLNMKLKGRFPTVKEVIYLDTLKK